MSDEALRITDAQRLRMIHGRLRAERDSVRRRLAMSLKVLRQNIERAEKHLHEGEGLDSNLIRNAADIDADIARWNLQRDVMLLVTDVE